MYMLGIILVLLGRLKSECTSSVGEGIEEKYSTNDEQAVEGVTSYNHCNVEKHVVGTWLHE